uniref:Uncharacterized protein n=1 Tax=Serratia marcescens TaxID=615 RepID=A0A1C3HNB5_SERMA|nr:hypothetical protein [Serratia marcescens]SAY46547.1 Uncharacterised protein [Serratia marcescens]
MIKKVSTKLLNFAVARPYMCLIISLVFLLLCSAKATEYMFYGRHLTSLLISILAFAIGAVFFGYFYMRNNLFLNKALIYLLKNKNDIAEGVVVDYLKVVAKYNDVEKEFDDYFSAQMHPRNVEICMNKIRELTLKKRNDHSRS